MKRLQMTIPSAVYWYCSVQTWTWAESVSVGYGLATKGHHFLNTQIRELHI